MPGDKVIILGGGVAGLSAAHELMERGFTVEVYEPADAPGGKAKSSSKPNSSVPPQLGLPGEHGFRFFPGFYQHVPDTMRRIPFATNPNGVADNLVTAPESSIAQETKPLYTFLTHLPHTLDDWLLLLKDWFEQPVLGLSPGEAEFFALRLLKIMSSCTKRRFAELENTSWWDYVDAQGHSFAYRNLLARGLTRSLVAMRAEEGSTRTVGCILIQMIMSMTSQSGTMDRVLNAPTSDAWITPWVNHLQNKGVKLFLKSTADSFQFDGTRITGVVVQGPNGQTTVTGDHYLAAFPVEVAQKKLSPLGKPSLVNLLNLKYESMNGLQFYLTRDVPCCHGHIICANSPWAVTCISQPQFWSGINMGQYGDGTIRGLISVDISDWTQPGNKTTPKTANQCTEAEIVAETWAQVMAHLASTSSPVQNGDLKDHYLDPSVIPTVGNTQPLLVNTKGSWVKRPTAATEIPNLFLASDYVQTNTDLATMEGANEAARRAVNEILKASNSTAQPCGVWPFREPAIFDPLKQLDEWLFDLNLPHPGFRTLKNTSSVANFLGF
jgi:uncharacterized protein with NAD-binding domain and iron-sulfur cluster